MPSRVLGWTSVLPAIALSLTACHDVPTAPNAIPAVPPTYTSFMLDRITGFDADVDGTWTGINVLIEPDQQTHIVSADTWDGLLRYAGCSSQCDQRQSWFTATADTDQFLMASSGAVITPAGINVISSDGASRGIRLSQCGGACNFSRNWRTSALFPGYIGWNGTPHANPLAADPSGGLHALYTTVGDAYPAQAWYAECPSNCLNPANWQSVLLDSGVALYLSFAVGVDASGRVHVTYERADSLHSLGLVYATCAASCITGANWQSTVIDSTVQVLKGASLAFGPGGRVHLAYLSQDSLRYATCGSNCTGVGAWAVGSLGQATNDVSLVADAGGLLHLATLAAHVAVSTCEENCASPGAWMTMPADSSAGGGFLSLGLDAAGHARVASGGNWLQYTQFEQ